MIIDHSPRYIEDFRSTEPDIFNGNSVTGDPDPDTDWWPAFARASVSHLSAELTDTLRKQNGIAVTIYLGKSRRSYKLSKSLPVFASFVGLFQHVQLQFTRGTDGLFMHYPDTQWDPEEGTYRSIGTFHPSVAPVPSELSNWKGYGPKGLLLKNLRLNGRSAPPCVRIVVASNI